MIERGHIIIRSSEIGVWPEAQQLCLFMMIGAVGWTLLVVEHPHPCNRALISLYNVIYLSVQCDLMKCSMK